ncbi:MAG TPA: histidine--tRNA ligase [Sphingomonas sp.]|nr:histidine--tRNA ligase [Sphingomonas sp.]
MARIETPRPIRGTQSMRGEEAERFQHVVDTFERVRRLYGFGRVELPVFEATAVFSRTLGETTDVVSKEMYTFEDRGGDSLTLRPEFTAGIARAYLTEGWRQFAPMKVATHGPLFRYERPQKGRFRQFHQLDAEVIGAAEPAADVELLCFADQLLRELKIEGVTLKLNTLGDGDSREAWRAALVEHFAPFREGMSEDSQRRLETNPLRILDSKDPRDAAAVAGAPTMVLSGEAADFYAKVQDGLRAAGVKFEEAPTLVRGLDYYRHTAFEFVPDAGSAAAEKMGSQSTLLGGGRYDGLMETLGGPHTPAVGWAAGIERLGMLVDSRASTINVAVVVENDIALEPAHRFAKILRENDLSVEFVATGSPRKRFDRATKMPVESIVAIDKHNDRAMMRVRADDGTPLAERLKALVANFE